MYNKKTEYFLYNTKCCKITGVHTVHSVHSVHTVHSVQECWWRYCRKGQEICRVKLCILPMFPNSVNIYTFIISCVNLKYAIIMHYMRDRLSLWYAVHFVIENLRKIKTKFENTLSQGPKWAPIMTENGGGQALWNTPIINGVN